MKKLLITFLAVAAVSFSSYGFSATYICKYPQKSMSTSLTNMAKNFSVFFYVAEKEKDNNPYVRYVAYNSSGGEIERYYVSPLGNDRIKIFTLRFKPQFEFLYKLNLYFQTGKPGDFAYVHASW